MTEEIMALCLAMGADEGQRALLLPLIEAAAAGLAGRLKRGVSPADCGKAFLLAAAMAAMDGLEGAAGLDRVESFTAGEVSIRTGQGGGGDSRSARALGLLAPWLEETGFAFRGVDG